MHLFVTIKSNNAHVSHNMKLIVNYQRLITITILVTRDCKKCEQYEEVITSIREDFVDLLSAWVVKVIDSQLIDIYSPDKEPALVFFRDFTPMLYNGKKEYFENH